MTCIIHDVNEEPTPTSVRVYAFSENIGRAIAEELRQFLEETKDDPRLAE